MALDRHTILLASRQGGFVSRQQLSDLGFSASSIDRRVNVGDLEPVTKGVYRALPSSDHADILRGAVLKLPRAVASHQSAAHLLQFPVLPTLEPTVMVHRRTTHVFPGVTVRRCDDLAAHHVTSVDGIATTTVARTCFDLAGVIAFPEFDRIAQALVSERRMPWRHLEAIRKDLGRRGKRGTAAVDRFMEARAGGTVVHPSVLEDRGRQLIRSAGLPQPIPEFPVPWDPDRRFDDAYPSPRLAIEWDSRRWHSQLDAMNADRERDRQAAINGWRIVRFTWSDVTERPNHVTDTIATLLDAPSR